MTDVLKHRAAGLCISFLLALLFAISAFTAANPIWGYSGVDSASFMLIGRGMLHGLIPYRDLVDNKGLVLYFINAIGQFFFSHMRGQAFGIWLIEFLFLFLSLRLINRFAEIFGCSKITSVILQVLYLMAIFPLIEMGNMGEEYTSFFTLLGLRLCARYLVEGKTDHFWFYGMGSGVLFTLCFFVRPNNALPLAGMILVLGIYFILQREWKNMLVSIGSFCLGTAVVVIPIVIYLAVNHALYDCISQTFLANMNYFGDSGSSFIGLLSTPYGHKAVIYFLVCVFGIYTACLKFEKSKPAFVFALGILAGAVFAFYSSFISGFAYLHYLLISMPTVIIGILLAVSGMRSMDLGRQKQRETEKKSSSFAAKIMYLLSIFCCFLLFVFESPLSFIGNLKGFPMAAVRYYQEGHDRTNQMSDLAAMIPENERDEVYILEEGESKSTDLYIQSGLFPYKRIFICGERFARLIPECAEEYKLYFTTEKPKWLILAIPLNDFEIPEQKAMIENDYMQVYTNDYGVSLYRLYSRY